MLALGEDPQALENLKQRLMSAFGPGDALWEKQIEDLAWLYCRRCPGSAAGKSAMPRRLIVASAMTIREVIRLDLELLGSKLLHILRFLTGHAFVRAEAVQSPAAMGMHHGCRAAIPPAISGREGAER